MEADLQIHCGVNYLDRWRTDGHRLTLRRIAVLLRGLPPESAVATWERKGRPHWTIGDHLADNIRMALGGKKAKPHPDRPRPQARRLDPDRIAAGQRRRLLRRRAIEAGHIT